jgi:hypothetical protein
MRLIQQSKPMKGQYSPKMKLVEKTSIKPAFAQESQVVKG